MGKRDDILDQALALFNAQGTAAVSTNHIAEALGISPGNLYYHFRNKEEIIRALLDRLFAAWDTGFALDMDTLPTLDDLQKLVWVNYTILWNYRFVYRELGALLRRDEVLRQQFNTVRVRGFNGFHALIGAFTAGGILRPLEPDVVQRLAELCWLITEFWLPSVEIGSETVDAAAMERGVALMMQVFAPYLNS